MWRFGFFCFAALVIGAAACRGCVQEGPDACDWTQWAHDYSHGADSCASGQALARKLAQITFDPFVTQEQAEGGGDLLVHYQTPLVMGDDVYMLVKDGAYVSCNPDGGPPQPCGFDAWGTQVWNEARLHRQPDGTLSEVWRFRSDWKPEPVWLAGWEPVFQPALYRQFLYVPGAGGTVFKLDRLSGAVLAHLNPFGDSVDPDTYVAGGLTPDADGSLYYNALKIDPGGGSADATGWLVKVSPSGGVTKATYASLVPGAPKADDLCSNVFPSSTPRPLPPPPDSSGNPVLPPTIPCGSQRPGLNVTPAIGADGTVFTVSRAHHAQRYSYVVAVHPDLTPRWATSLRGILHDGCGVLVPADATPDAGNPFDCRQGAEPGVEPLTNEQPAGIALDVSSSSPVALPDGTVLYGAFTPYNGARGHLFRFSADGQPLGTYDFGWDVTPAYYRHDGTYSIVLKDNHYAGSDGQYLVTQLSPDFKREWSYQSTNTESCAPDGGGLSCVSDHPWGFEWCVNAPAVDPEGTVFVNSEDGFLYAIGQGAVDKGRVFLNLATGAAYTPVAVDAQGRIYAINGGVLSVVGR